MRTISSNHAASGCYTEVFLSLLRQMVTMDTLAALVVRHGALHVCSE